MRGCCERFLLGQRCSHDVSGADLHSHYRRKRRRRRRIAEWYRRRDSRYPGSRAAVRSNPQLPKKPIRSAQGRNKTDVAE